MDSALDEAEDQRPSTWSVSDVSQTRVIQQPTFLASFATTTDADVSTAVGGVAPAERCFGDSASGLAAH